MLAYLELDATDDGLTIELAKESRLGQYNPKYHETVKQIFNSKEIIDGIVIPDDLGSNYDYDVLLMIIHIRLFFDKNFSQIPIYIYLEGDGRFYDYLDRNNIIGDVSERTYKSIGVSIIGPILPDHFEPLEIDESELERFLREKAGYPWFTQGRHDQANRWGPYVFLFILNYVFNDKFYNKLLYVENEMFSEPYFKWLARGIKKDQRQYYSLTSELFHAHQKLGEKLKSIRRRRILVVEDKLEEGWRNVYDTVFCDSEWDVDIIWAQTVEEALSSFYEDLALVILDMRLSSNKRERDQPEGINLLSKLRRELPYVPVLVATASNKTWMLQKLTDRGIDAYWVKASPEIDIDFLHALENVTDFYRKVISTLEWSVRTRDWIEGLYHIEGSVRKTDIAIGNQLREKAHSFHALLQRSFTPFSNEISDGLQLNIAFLIAYSCMNDLISWVCTIDTKEENGEDVTIWSTMIDGKKDELVRMQMMNGEDPTYYLQNGSKYGNNRRHDFPDNLAAQEVMMRYGLTGQKLDFQKKMSVVRNGLPLTHGKTGNLTASINEGRSVIDSDVTCIISIISALVDAHIKQAA